ncbi:hypothetical protein VCHA39O220_90028 [Vibrio chagasii]|nr:hypothetical protein VCHA34P129_100014 [Vibrio chagasii]CAH6807047.1 hypothetical protein VCHA32O87_110178 [Vibrio chagasii]CAH6903619.1 hypothetical protein VCHA54O485_100012 [Vibrio chagasii]CAH6906152.1 hypothetical protein VCHA52P455_100029 [Vibrio chagasii]CAH6922808.1 hypothetical protein VCHA54P499_100003 [Vibrio chagasii]
MEDQETSQVGRPDVKKNVILCPRLRSCIKDQDAQYLLQTILK